jgi:hypothetical protein
MTCEIILNTNKTGHLASSSCNNQGPRSCLPLLSDHPHTSPRLSSSLPSLILIPVLAHPHRSPRSSSSLPSLRFFSIWLFQHMESSKCITEDFIPTYLVYWHIVSKYHWLRLTLNKALKNVILMT